MLAHAAARSAWTALIGALALSSASAQTHESAKSVSADNATRARTQDAMATLHPGKAVYEQSCAACHNHPEATRAPALETLKAMRY